MSRHGLAGHHSRPVVVGLGRVTLLRRDTVGRHPIGTGTYINRERERKEKQSEIRFAVGVSVCMLFFGVNR